VQDNVFKLETWSAYHDDTGTADDGDKDKIGNGSGQQSFTMQYSGLCIRDEFHAVIHLNPENGFSVTDHLTQYRLMKYEEDIPKESLSNEMEPTTMLLMGTELNKLKSENTEGV
jgi:hypothetical protein